MIYTQTIVAAKRALTIIPPGIMPALFRVQAKRIRKSPLSDIFKSRSLAFAEENVAFPLPLVAMENSVPAGTVGGTRNSAASTQ